jgi:exopolysaccharide/PEP-CTERM locus tyrosine autokinase
MVESLQLKPRLNNEIITQQIFQSLPMSELLVTCGHDGNREANLATEQYKMLRSQLLFPVERSAPRTILVTSAIPGEGKSVVAGNLAVSIALRKQEHALLIECDLRRPSLCNIFGLSNCTGLSDYLHEEVELSNILCKTAIEKLTLLPAGRLTGNPHELITSKRMMELLKEVRNRYEDRYIILDSPPAQVAAETRVLSQFVDGIVLVVRCGKSSRKVIQESLKQLEEDKLFGVVLNCYEGKYTSAYSYEYYGQTKKSFLDKFRRK